MVVGLARGAHMGSSRVRPRSLLYAPSTDVDGTIVFTASFGSARPLAAQAPHLEKLFGISDP